MSKVCVIADTHWGIKGDSPVFLEHFSNYFIEQFFPYLKANGIKRILHLGDFTDRRKYCNYSTLSNIRSNFMDMLDKNNITMDIILGNHDVYYRQTNKLNSLNQLFSTHPCITIHEKCTELDLDGTKIALIPWINNENEKETLDFLEHTNASLVFGHFEMEGFFVVKGIKCEKGLARRLLQKFEHVYSGHFHIKQTQDNITYVGSPYEMFFSDLGTQKGFHVFDTKTKSMTFVENTHKIFHKIEYADDITEPDDYKNCYVKLIVKSKNDPYKFDKFVEKIGESNPAHLSIIDENLEKSTITEEDVNLTENTLTIINNEIDALTDFNDISRLKKLMHRLYSESLELDNT